MEQRSRKAHEAWLAGISAPILRLDGAEPIESLQADVLSAIYPGGANVRL
jgi:hypothetical protein